MTEISDIKELIQNEKDAEKRATYFTLLCIAEKVSINSEKIKSHEGLVSKHERILIQGRVLWGVGIALVAAIQAGTAVVGGYVFNNIEDLTKNTIQLTENVSNLKDDVKGLKYNVYKLEKTIDK